jgi:ribonuclease-3
MASEPQHTDNLGDGALESIEMALGHSFADADLLVHALTHTSFTAENHGATSYERLEFLGDAVLELSTTDVIFSLLVDASEGRMTRVRASVVDITTLAEVARAVGLADLIRLGVGEARSGGAGRDSILSDTMEAVLGAIYIDGGYEVAHAVIAKLWTPIIASRVSAPMVIDGRSRLQELVAQRGGSVTFEYERTGPDHAAVYSATVLVDGETAGTGTAGSKKAAAIAASENALRRVGEAEHEISE